MGRYSDELDALSEDYLAAKVPEGGNKLPDGTWQVRVESVEIKESQNSDRLYLAWKLVCTHGEYEGSSHVHFRTIDKDNVTWLKKELTVCGLELASLSELEDRLEEVLDVVIEIAVKTKPGTDKKTGNEVQYTNTYFNKRLDGNEGDYAPPGDGDVPGSGW